MDGQKNWGKCRFSQRISCLAFSSFRWGKPMRGIPLSLKDRKAGLGLYGVDLVRLIWFFFPRVTFLNEQLHKWICATLLISLREGSCFGVGCVHLHVGVNVKITAICTGTIYRESRCIPTKNNALMSVFLSDGTYHSAEEYILLYVQYQQFSHIQVTIRLLCADWHGLLVIVVAQTLWNLSPSITEHEISGE